MTDKQAQFVEEYLIDLNATKAAIRAGYSEDSAKGIAWELMQKPDIAAAIDKGKLERIARTRVTADRVVVELARIAFSDIRTFLSWSGRDIELKASEEISDDDAACIEEISENLNAQGMNAIKIKLHSKLRALELLGKHTGAFDLLEDDKKNLTINLNYSMDDKKEAAP